MRADNTHHLLAAARRRAIETRRRAITALRRLEGAGQPVTFDTVAKQAAVSRSWLYSQPDLRAETQRLRGGRPGPGASTAPPVPARQRASEASLRRRLETVNTEIRRLRQENQRLGEQLAWALGERRAAEVRGPTVHEGASKRSSSTTIGPCS